MVVTSKPSPIYHEIGTDGCSVRQPRATIDFESRSACSIKKSGSWRYSLDPSTDVLCLAFRLPYWEQGRTGLWHPEFAGYGLDEEGLDDFAELFQWIAGGHLVEAHNAWFERGIWKNILVPRYGAIRIDHVQWRCSAAKAAAHALPRKLELACDALALIETKDIDGHKLMLKMTKPRKARKAEREAIAANPEILWHESNAMFRRLCDYCRQDVLAEEGVSLALDDLSPAEDKVWLLDQRINERGFMLDRDAMATAQRLIKEETVILNGELAVLTEGVVLKATQRAQMMAWLGTQGLHIDNTQKETIDRLLESRDTPWREITVMPAAWRALEIMRTLGRSSTSKFKAMRNWICPDDRVHGGILYHGATTGRWSGAGIQPHNFPKGTLKEKSQETLWHVLSTSTREEISALYRSVMEALSHGLRGVIVAPDAHDLYVADYAAIEARVLLWLAGDEEALGIFHRGEDIYSDFAERNVYHYPVSRDTATERGMGKIAVLGLGYQMGWSKFQATCASFGVEITEEFAQQVVAAYRDRFWRVKEMWNAQERAAIRAVQGEFPVTEGYVTWEERGYFLYCRLPSGREIAYPFPEIHEKETPWGEMRPVLTFMGMNTYSHKWERQSTYGGSIVENIVQAIARDIMAEAMMRCEASGIYLPVLTVHDEIVAYALSVAGNLQQYIELVARVPLWAPGCPIEAEAWSGKRYRK